MYVERMLYPVTTLGPGKRIAIWLQGCIHMCPKCINKELWKQREESFIPVDMLYECIREICNSKQVDGITFTGGDPLFQKEELQVLTDKLKQDNIEILVYTGYKISEIRTMESGKRLLDNIDVLIDGKYIDELNVDNLALRGSSNQNIILLNEKLKNKYDDYLSKGRNIENFYVNDYMISVGIHNKERVCG